MSVTINEKFLVSRMQQRKGERINLPQPLKSGELGWAYDTKQLFIGSDERYPISGVEIYNMSPVGSEQTANRILNNQILEILSTNIPGNVIIEEVTEGGMVDPRVPTDVEFDQFAESFREYLYDATIEIIASLNNWDDSEMSHYHRAQEDGYASDKFVLFSYYETMEEPVFDDNGLFISNGTYRFKYIIGFLESYIYDENGENEKTGAVIAEYLSINDSESIYDDFIFNVSTNLQNFENGSLDNDKYQDSGNIAQLINLLSFSLDPEYETGLVTTKQNVEIITEFSPTDSDISINPITHVLAPTYTNIINVPGDPDAASATASINLGEVDFITVTNKGFGYMSTPNITFSGGDGDGNVTATATLVNNTVDSIEVVTGGSGYTVAPDVIIEDTLGFVITDDSGNYYYSLDETHFSFDGSLSFHVEITYEIYAPVNDINNTIYHASGTMKILNNYGKKITTLSDNRTELVHSDDQKNIEFTTYFDDSATPPTVRLLYRHNFADDIGIRIRSVNWAKP